MAVTTRLEINGTSQAFTTNIPVSITFALADVREPDKRKASFSKTISLYATNEINILFENIFEVNVATQYFNKNIKTPCKYFVNEELNFKGDLQLLKIILKPDNNIVYECSIIGEGGSLFVDVGEKYITGNTDLADDLDFSAYDHTYDRATQISTRANYGTGLDVVYPFINRGTNNGGDSVFNVSDFFPCFHVWEYINKIIAATGRTYTSAFLDSAEFKKYIVYPNIETIPLSATQLDDSQFYVGLSSDLTISANTLTTITHGNESAPFFDVGGQYTGSVATINNTGYYNVVSHQKFQFSFTHSDGTVTYAIVSTTSLAIIIEKSTDGGTTWNPIVWQNNYLQPIPLTANVSTNYSQTFEAATGEIQLNAGDKLRARCYLVGSAIAYYNASNVLVTTGTATWVYKLLSGSTGTSFYALLTRKTVLEGGSLEANNALPIKIKQRDFLKSIIQAFNLFVEQDKDDEDNIIIEPFEDFYNATVDYENRTDLDKDEVINPNLLEGKRYIFKYKDDTDYYNQLYKDTWNETFGSEIIDVENDFIKEDKVNELIFSPTPNVANYDLGIAHPKIYKKEDVTIKPHTPNVRLLFCGGTKQTVNPYTYKESGQTDLVTTDYLYAGHTDDPFTPTIDLNFGTPRELYYTFIQAYITDNNLYNRYHKNWLANIINRDSKFLNKYLWFTPIDVKNFSFRNKLFVDSAYYIVNKILDYDPLEEDSTNFELIKLLTLEPFSPTQTLVNTLPTVQTGQNISQSKQNTSLSFGNNIVNKGTNSVAIGNNIIIPEDATNVTLIGNNLRVEGGGLSNISLINTNDYTVSRSNISVNRNSIQTNSITASVTTTDATPTYVVFDNPSYTDFYLQEGAYKVQVRILAVNTSSHAYKEWEAKGLVKNEPPAAVLYDVVQAVTSIFSDASMATSTLAITGGAASTLRIQVTGIAATTIDWAVVIDYIEITF